MTRLTFVVVLCFIAQCFCVQLRLFRNNFRMQNVSVIEPAYSLMECAARFVNEKTSHTFNFHEGDKKCELSVLYPEEGGLESEGWNMYSVIYDGKYYPSNKTANWVVAQEVCTNMSAKLVMIDDESEQAVLERIVEPAITTVRPHASFLQGRKTGSVCHAQGQKPLSVHGLMADHWEEGIPAIEAVERTYFFSSYALCPQGFCSENWYPGKPGKRAAIWMGYGGYMWGDDYWSRQKNFICEFL